MGSSATKAAPQQVPPARRACPGQRTVRSRRHARSGPRCPLLTGNGSYDALRIPEQAVVRAAWDEQVSATIAALDLQAEFIAAGKPGPRPTKRVVPSSAE